MYIVIDWVLLLIMASLCFQCWLPIVASLLASEAHFHPFDFMYLRYVKGAPALVEMQLNEKNVANIDFTRTFAMKQI